MTPPDWERDPLYRPFTPTATKIIGATVTIVLGSLMLLVALVIPGGGAVNTAFFVLLIVVTGWFMYRLGGCKATPSPERLVVRNLMGTTTLEWAQIVNVRFGDAPWPQLDLSDGDVIAVMGIQRADGARSQQEAVRLADLVQRHGTATR